MLFRSSVDEIKKASETEIANIVGSSVAKAIFSYFQQKKEEKYSISVPTKTKSLKKKTTKKAALESIKEEQKTVKK